MPNGKVISDIGEIQLLENIILPYVECQEGDDKLDDCSRISFSGNNLLWSIDPCPTPVANFFNLATPDVWGHYTAAINLSDIAASGGTPLGVLVSLETPENTSSDDIIKFQTGLKSILFDSGNVPLLGGNVKSAKKFSSTATIIGLEGHNRVTRSIPSENCFVYMIGESGNFWTSVLGNYLGWGNLSIGEQNNLNRALCFPKVQTEAGKMLGNLPFEVACMDCSDGVPNSLYQLAKINSLGIKIYDTQKLIKKQYSSFLSEQQVKVENVVLHFGDWQLICLVSVENSEYFEKIFSDYCCKKIGEARSTTKGHVFHEDGRSLSKLSLNQNFTSGYNSMNNIDVLISKYMLEPIFI